MGKAVFVTGTGTDVGKTYVTGLLVKKMQANYYKPVLSGAKFINEKLIAMDALKIIQMSGLKAKPNDLVSFVFEEALSPHLASKRANFPIELDKIKKDYQLAKKNSDYLFVEGAGGIICPFRDDNEQLMLVDVIHKLNLPILIVCTSRLGSINATMLTVEYARSKEIKIAGIIMNNFVKNNLICEDNKRMIEKLSKVQVIDTVAKGQKELMISKNKLASLF
ncbi:MAG: dethiobiotin synthase [Lactobacillales bacterium]|nr:dethiobiotin synthase [Lactobacillales bacterium]